MILGLLNLPRSIRLENVVLSAETVFPEWYAYLNKPYRTGNIFKRHYLRRLYFQKQPSKLPISDQKKHPEKPGCFKENSVLIRSRSGVLMNITLDSHLLDQIKLTIDEIFMLFFIDKDFQQ